MDTFDKVLLCLLGIFFSCLLAITYPGCSSGRMTDADKAASTVMVLRSPGGGGGTGVVVQDGYPESLVLTNQHVCAAISKGGVVVSEGGAYRQALSYRASREHDLCLLSVAGRLGPAAEVAKQPPDQYSQATVSGHPHLMPTVLSKGDFGGRQVIDVLTGIKPCSQEDTDRMSRDGNMEGLLMCALLGGIPQLRSFEAQLVGATIQPGNSGSAVYDQAGRVAGVAFAAEGDLSYAWIVPQEAVARFMERELPGIDPVPVGSERGADEALRPSRKGAGEFCAAYPSGELGRKFCMAERRDTLERGEE